MILRNIIFIWPRALYKLHKRTYQSNFYLSKFCCTLFYKYPINYHRTSPPNILKILILLFLHNYRIECDWRLKNILSDCTQIIRQVDSSCQFYQEYDIFYIVKDMNTTIFIEYSSQFVLNLSFIFESANFDTIASTRYFNDIIFKIIQKLEHSKDLSLFIKEFKNLLEVSEVDCASK